MKKTFLFVVASLMTVSCSKKSDTVKTPETVCYECTQLIEKSRNEVVYSFQTHTSTRCNVDQQTIDSETKEKNYVVQKDGITTTSTFACKRKDQ